MEKDQPLETIQKEWGQEKVLKREPYTIKVMSLKKGYYCSLHLHREKEETFTLLKGKLKITTISKAGEESHLVLENPGDSLTIKPMTPHTFKSLEGNATFLECSTEDKVTDSYRIYPSGRDLENNG
jgi:mannose-6-phosphate isomerase-like protein (cupin superfamily)